MSLVGIAKLNGLYSFAEQRGLSLEEGFEALKFQMAGSSRLALTRSLISGGLTQMASRILNSSRQLDMVVKLQLAMMRLQQYNNSLIGFTILILFGWGMLRKSRTNHTRNTG